MNHSYVFLQPEPKEVLMFYAIVVWVLLLNLWPWLKRQRLADKLSVTRIPLVLVIMHGLLELKGITQSPSWVWVVPTELGIAWLALSCMLTSFVLDILDGRVARDSKAGATKWGRFWDATTDKISTWPIAILLWGTVYTKTDLVMVIGWHVPVTLLFCYDIWSTRNHYLKAMCADDQREHESGKNRLGHIAGQCKHWSWSLMIGFHVFAMCPIVPDHGSSVSNQLAKLGAWLMSGTYLLVIAAAVFAVTSMVIRRRLAKSLPAT